MRHHLSIKFKIGISSHCHTKLAEITVEHVLDNCSFEEDLRKRMWPTLTTLKHKLYDGIEILKQIADYI
uniref:Uncharacterized protein n=1 Tax=Arion vulgaris TaxID=1028688 RepID=A0A0B7AQB9_9EUPU